MKKILIASLAILLISSAIEAYALSAAVQAVCGANGTSCTASTPETDNSEIGTITAGGSSASIGTARMYCMLYQADCTGTLGTAYLYGLSNAAKISVYSTTDTDHASTPTVGTLVGYSGAISFGGEAGWVNSATNGGSVTSGNYYWLCIHTTTTSPTFYYTTGLNRWYIDITGVYTTPPSALPVAGDCTGSKTPYSCCTDVDTGCTWTGLADRKMSGFVGIQ
jgi:hypothetical protein